MCRRNRSGRVDPCIRRLVEALRRHPDFEIIALCCGHGRYPMTLVVRDRGTSAMRELLNGAAIPRCRSIYRKDAYGFYYVPEVSSASWRRPPDGSDK